MLGFALGDQQEDQMNEDRDVQWAKPEVEKLGTMAELTGTIKTKSPIGTQDDFMTPPLS